MNEETIVKLAQKIYVSHKAALDIISEHRPKSEREVWSKFIKDLVAETKSFELGVCGVAVVRFWPKNKWNFAGIEAAKNGAFKNVPILFEAHFSLNNAKGSGGLRLELVIGNISVEDTNSLFQKVIREANLIPQKTPESSYPRPWRHGKKWIILDSSEEDKTINEEKIKRSWEAFVKDEPRISEAVSRALDSFLKNESCND